MNGVFDNPWGERDVSSGKNAGDENFPVGSFLLHADKRPCVHAYYNFARVADDIADSVALTADEKINRLNAMEDVLFGRRIPPLERQDAMSASHLRQALEGKGVEFLTASDLLVAFRQDAVKETYKNWDELLEYCRFSANPVGRFLLQLHGEHSQSFIPSDALCTALQILNHLQDCKKDQMELHRCYLPQNWMQQEGVTTEDVMAPSTSPALRRVFNRMLDEVDMLNKQAKRLTHLVSDRRMRMESAVIVGLSMRLSRKLRIQDPLSMRVKLKKMDIAAAAVASLRYI